MARPIKDTPIVSGKDAVRFAERMANPKRVSKEEIERARTLYEAVKAQSKFAL
jgi:hypothetical protein